MKETNTIVHLKEMVDAARAKKIVCYSLSYCCPVQVKQFHDVAGGKLC